MTKNRKVQDSPKEDYGLLSSEERDILGQIASKEAPYSQRAQALLVLGEGATQADAAHQAGLTPGQVHYRLAKFRRDGMDIFPQELLDQAQPVTQDDVPDGQDLVQSQDEGDAQLSMMDAEEATGPVDDETAQPEDKSKSEKKPKKKSKKKPKKKSKKKSKKSKKEKKPKKNKSSKKAGGQKGKSGKKKRKNR